MKKVYAYLVRRKSDGEKFVMIGNLKNPNIGCYKYLFPFVSPQYEYAQRTPYGLISNVTVRGVVYDPENYDILGETELVSEKCTLAKG